MVRAIQREDPTFPVDAVALEAASVYHDMEGFFEWFRCSALLHHNPSTFWPVAKHQITRLRAQHVYYVEWWLPMGSFGLDEGRELALMRVRAFRAWVNACIAKTENAPEISFNVAIGRNRPVEQIAQREEVILALYEAGLIAGVALAGPEPGYPVKPFTRTFARLHEAGLGIEIHAGEWCGPESVWDALEYGFPDRIGHGVALFQDPELIALFQERQIHVEMCPTSNLRTGSIARIEDHPIGKAKDLGLNFSVNTDDPGAFGCSMNSEYALLSEVFGFEEADFERLYVNSMKARFHLS